ncbi:hypothetical protein J3459_011849 [Metarhizium acridum]|nr:hypothetical protein J3459_011849 [Metarhizium acridum]
MLSSRMAADKPTACALMFQMNVFDMIHHMRYTVEGMRAYAIWEPLFADTIYTLRLTENKREFLDFDTSSCREASDKCESQPELEMKVVALRSARRVEPSNPRLGFCGS